MVTLLFPSSVFAAEVNSGQYPGLSAWVTDYGLQVEVYSVYYNLTNTGLHIVSERNPSNFWRYASSDFSDRCEYASVYFKFPNASFYNGSTECYNLRFEFKMRVNNGMPVDWFDSCIFFTGNGDPVNAQITGSLFSTDAYYFKFDVYIESDPGQMLDLSEGLGFTCRPASSWPGSPTSSANYFEFSPFEIGTCTVVASADPNDGVLLELDKINVLLSSGNSNSQAATGTLNDSVSDFNNIAGQYDQVEGQYTEQMKENLNAIAPTVSEFGFTGNLLTASLWFGEQLTNVFDRLYDFKNYIIIPLILGLALFFIGRGSMLFGDKNGG